MHDGRFKTLEEVLQFYTNGVQKSPSIDPKMHFNHSNGVTLTSDEQESIILFLNSLTDSTLISSPQFSDPFKN
jgi:cytochrome c peroxidase